MNDNEPFELDERIRQALNSPDDTVMFDGEEISIAALRALAEALPTDRRLSGKELIRQARAARRLEELANDANDSDDT